MTRMTKMTRSALSIIVALAAIATAATAYPGSNGLQAATCGGPGEQECRVTEACTGVDIWIWTNKICTTTTDYWQIDDTEGDGSGEEDDPFGDPTAPCEGDCGAGGTW